MAEFLYRVDAVGFRCLPPNATSPSEARRYARAEYERRHGPESARDMAFYVTKIGRDT